jgi:2-polyprenyl-6-methoxyphenol hydroxylase-like FAD-dependent oxidoreductase
LSISDNRTTVAVVGAGPTGAMLAIELARRGIEVSILEKQPARPCESRAIGIHARTLEVFDQLGIVDQFLELGHRVDGLAVHRRAGHPVRIHFSGIDSPYPFMLTLSQAETQRILEERLEELGVKVRRGVRVLDLLEDGDGVAMRTIQFGEERERTVQADWVVGCDGAHSMVRQSLGLSFEGDDYSQDWLMAEANIDRPLARDHFHLFAYTALPLPVFPMPEGRWRIFIPQVAGGSRNGRPPEMEEIEKLVAMRGPAGMKLSDPSLLATFRCYLRSSRVARKGRVLIAGDAAHVHSPAGGQGMNTGIHDAFNLGWKLALVAQGHAPAALLDTYQEERGPIAADVMAVTDRLVRTFTISSPSRRWLRDRVLPAVGTAPVERRLATRLSQVAHNYRGRSLAPSARRSQRGSIRPGDRLPDVPGLRLGTEEVTVLRLLDAPAHTLFVMAGRHPDPATLEDVVTRFARWQALARTVVIDASGSALDRVVGDPGLRAHRRYEALHGRLVLVRPDGYVACSAPPSRPGVIERYLERLTGSGSGKRSHSIGATRHAPRPVREIDGLMSPTVPRTRADSTDPGRGLGLRSGVD